MEKLEKATKVVRAIDAARILFEDEVCTLFREKRKLEESYPANRRLSDTQIMEEIGNETGYSGLGIRRILIKRGEYAPKFHRTVIKKANKNGKRNRTTGNA